MSKKTSKNKFILWIATRYLFSKKSHNAVNIISGISVLGVSVATLALIVILSVFNGFDSLLEKTFSAFDPDLEISLIKGKRFEWNNELENKIKNIKGVEQISGIIKESALVRYSNRQTPVIIMGVDDNYHQVTDIDKIIYDGKFSVNKNDKQQATIGIGIALRLGLNIHSFEPLIINAPNRTEKINLVRPETSLITEIVQVGGIFALNQPDYDDRIVMVSLPVAKSLFQYDDNIFTSIQLKINPKQNVDDVKKKILELLGNEYQVLNKYEQQKDYFNITKIEKWITYLILSFILMIAIFNIIGSLSLLIIEKKESIETLRMMGASEQMIKNIFLFEGWLISISGAIIGLILGIIIILIQQYFGILRIGEGTIVEFYPIKLSFYDIIITLTTVITISFFSVLYPIKYITNQVSKKR